ncbi:MAG: PIN domain-containing protein [Acetobacteraceae bacterium]
MDPLTSLSVARVTVVDSSVWIAHFRGVDTAPVRKLASLDLDVGLLVGDLVLLEVLQGARDATDARRMHDDLCQFEMVQMLSAVLAIKAAANYRLLRSLGITIRKTPDLIIGTYCIEHHHSLLHDDREFEPMRIHLGLQVH